jgi:hypothetical protein
MKSFCCAVVLFLAALPAFADTYTGVVSGVKHFAKGGVAVDMDGKYPDQKMTLYVSPKDEATVGALPAEGAKVTATGEVTPYHGKPEIKIHAADQWKW